MHRFGRVDGVRVPPGAPCFRALEARNHADLAHPGRCPASVLTTTRQHPRRAPPDREPSKRRQVVIEHVGVHVLSAYPRRRGRASAGLLRPAPSRPGTPSLRFRTRPRRRPPRLAEDPQGRRRPSRRRTGPTAARRCQSCCTTIPRTLSDARRSRATGERDPRSASTRAQRRSESAHGAQTVTSGCVPRCAIRVTSLGRPQHQQTPMAAPALVAVDMGALCSHLVRPASRSSKILGGPPRGTSSLGCRPSRAAASRSIHGTHERMGPAVHRRRSTVDGHRGVGRRVGGLGGDGNPPALVTTSCRTRSGSFTSIASWTAAPPSRSTFWMQHV